MKTIQVVDDDVDRNLVPHDCCPGWGNMEVAAGRWSEIFEGDGGREAHNGGDVMLGSSTLTLTPLVDDSPSVRRSQPIFISSNRWGFSVGCLWRAVSQQEVGESPDAWLDFTRWRHYEE